LRLRRSGPARRAPVPLLLLVGVLSACGGNGDSKGTVGGTLPPCANAGSAIVLPEGLADFPLPDGGVIDKSRRDAAGNTVFEGYVPGDLEAARDYYNEELSKHGYNLGEGDAEEHEAETDFEGHGVDAHMKLNELAGCEGALTLEVGLR
jgi:hypothetical protein